MQRAPRAPVVLPCGPNAAMLEVVDTDAAVRLAGWLTGERDGGRVDLTEVVPGARTVLVRCDRPGAIDAVITALDGFTHVAAERAPGDLVEISVRYDGADLHDVADAVGCSVDEVVRRHTGTEYLAAFSGFAPGFTYLTGLHPSLHLPRRPDPRAAVPAGSVAIGGEFTGVYPTASPGGWHLLGRTDAVLWDIDRPPHALMPPGCRVRFVDVAGRPA